MKWYFAALKKYAVLSGRAARREIWYFLLCNLIVWIFFAAVDWMAGGFRDEGYPELFSELYGLVIVIPFFAVSVRRLHDSELSGWWVLIGFVPLIGGPSPVVCADMVPSVGWHMPPQPSYERPNDHLSQARNGTPGSATVERSVA